MSQKSAGTLESDKLTEMLSNAALLGRNAGELAGDSAIKYVKVRRLHCSSPQGWFPGDKLDVEIDGGPPLAAYATKVNEGKLLEAWVPEGELRLRFTPTSYGQLVVVFPRGCEHLP